MAWGDAFKSAWNSATNAARSSAAALATGAQWVGKQAVNAVTWAADKAVDAATWAGGKTVNAAKWAVANSKDAARGGIRTIADKGFDFATAAKDKSESIGKGVRGVFDRIEQVFGKKAVTVPSSPCPVMSPLSDVDMDGILISGACSPLTKKGSPITNQDIANAKQNGYQSQSECCKAKREAGKPPRTIFYVNGIMTPKKVHCETLKAIGDSTCATVIGIYNATEGRASDSFQTGKDRLLIKAAEEGHPARAHDGRNPAIDTLSDVVYKEVLAGNPPEIWAHSQGGAVTSLALYDANNRLEMANLDNSLKSVKVKTFGSAAPNWADGPEYEHYVHVNDATPMYFGLGDNPLQHKERAGSDAKVIPFSGPAGGPFKESDLEKNFVPSNEAYHGVENVYIKMQDQTNENCTGKP